MLAKLKLSSDQKGSWLKSKHFSRGIKAAAAAFAILYLINGAEVAAVNANAPWAENASPDYRIAEAVWVGVTWPFVLHNMMKVEPLQRLGPLPKIHSQVKTTFFEAPRPRVPIQLSSVTTPSVAEPSVVEDHRSGLNQADLTANAVLLKPTTKHAASEELKCLAQNIYFEARSEPVKGKLAVAHVVMNRVASPRFPNTVCGVVHQGGYALRHRCQFSWWCDGKSETITNRRAWLESLELAHRAYRDRSDDPTGNALWYHAAYVSPNWRSDFVEGPKIGRHIFYSERTSIASMVEVASNQSIN